MLISKSEFISVLKRAMPGIETGTVILEGSDSFVFANGFIYSYNDNISIASKLPDDAVGLLGTVNAMAFYTLLNRFSDDVLKIVVKDDRWIIKSGSARVELTLLADHTSDYVHRMLPENPTWETIPVQFFDGLKLSVFGTNRSALSGVYIGKNIITSTDEMRINWLHIDSPISGVFWIGDKAVSELLKIVNLTKLCISSSWVHFISADGTTFSCKKLQHDKYPIKKIMELVKTIHKSPSDIAGTLSKGFADAVNRAATLSIDIESFMAVKLTFDRDGVEIFSERFSGRYLEKVLWDTPLISDFEAISIYVDHAMIETGIRQSNSFYLKHSIVDKKERTKIIFEHELGVQIIGTFDGK